MRTIKKGIEPTCLREYRELEGERATYRGYSPKNNLRSALVEEQGGICCYCCSEISADTDSMKVEHFWPRSKYSKLQLCYINLMAACKGNEGRKIRPKDQHCDTRKGSSEIELRILPELKKAEDVLYYDEHDGAVKCTDEEFDWQINCVLNLNHESLKSLRLGVIAEVDRWLVKNNPCSNTLKQEIDRRSNVKNRNGLEPFSPVAVWKLKQHLGKTTV